MCFPRCRQGETLLCVGLGLFRLPPIGVRLDLLRLVDDGAGDVLGVLNGDHDVAVLVLQRVAFLPDHDIAIGILVHGNAAIGAQDNVAVVLAPIEVIAPSWRAPCSASAGSANRRASRRTYRAMAAAKLAAVRSRLWSRR